MTTPTDKPTPDQSLDDLLCDILDLCCVDTDHSKGVQLIGPNFDKAKALLNRAVVEGRQKELRWVQRVKLYGMEPLSYLKQRVANRLASLKTEGE